MPRLKVPIVLREPPPARLAAMGMICLRTSSTITDASSMSSVSTVSTLLPRAAVCARVALQEL